MAMYDAYGNGPYGRIDGIARDIAHAVESLLECEVRWDVENDVLSRGVRLMLRIRSGDKELGKAIDLERFMYSQARSEEIDHTIRHIVSDFRHMQDEKKKKGGYKKMSTVDRKRVGHSYDWHGGTSAAEAVVKQVAAKGVVDKHMTQMQAMMRDQIMAAIPMGIIDSQQIMNTYMGEPIFKKQKAPQKAEPKSYREQLQSDVDAWLK